MADQGRASEMERALVERARNGDRHAFAVLAASAVDRLYRVAYSVHRDVELARDATQQSLLEAWRDLPPLRDVDRWDGVIILIVAIPTDMTMEEWQPTADGFIDTIHFLSDEASSVE